MTALRLLVDLLLIAPRLALAWFKLLWAATALPRVPHCRDCGWRLPWDTASLICNGCQIARRQEARRQRSHPDCDCHCHREMDVVNACGDCGFGDDLRIADFKSGGAR